MKSKIFCGVKRRLKPDPIPVKHVQSINAKTIVVPNAHAVFLKSRVGGRKRVLGVICIDLIKTGGVSNLLQLRQAFLRLYKEGKVKEVPSTPTLVRVLNTLRRKGAIK